MHAFDRQTDGQTDRRTAFSSVVRAGIPCSAEKIISESCVNLLEVTIKSASPHLSWHQGAPHFWSVRSTTSVLQCRKQVSDHQIESKEVSWSSTWIFNQNTHNTSFFSTFIHNIFDVAQQDSIDLQFIITHPLRCNEQLQARIQDFLTGGVDCRGVPPSSLPFPPFPSPSLLPPSPPLPFPLPPSLPSLRSRPP